MYIYDTVVIHVYGIHVYATAQSHSSSDGRWLPDLTDPYIVLYNTVVFLSRVITSYIY